MTRWPRTTPTLVPTYTVAGSAGSTTTPRAGAVIRGPGQAPRTWFERNPHDSHLSVPSKNHRVSRWAPVPESVFSPVVVTYSEPSGPRSGLWTARSLTMPGAGRKLSGALLLKSLVSAAFPRIGSRNVWALTW